MKSKSLFAHLMLEYWFSPCLFILRKGIRERQIKELVGGGGHGNRIHVLSSIPTTESCVG